MKSCHFVNHSFIETRVEPHFDFGIENVFGRAEREEQRMWNGE